MPRLREVPVLVTGIGGGGHGEQILKALRLGKLKYRIVGADVSAACANKPFVDEFSVLPRATEPGYLEALVKLASEWGCVAIFHGSEAEMAVLSRARTELTARGFYVPVNSPSVLRICQDKVLTLDYLSKQGFKTPAFCRADNIDDLKEFDSFPAIVKPAVGGGGSANTFIVQGRSELRAIVAYLLQFASRLTVQEYVGTPDAEFTVGVLFDKDLVLLNSIAIRRVLNNALSIRIRVLNRTGRADLGEHLVVSTGISQGQVGRWPDILTQCERIATGLHPTAPVNIQCRVVNGVVLPFEINPRFSGTTSLRAMAGYSEPDILIRRDVFGEAIEPGFAYEEMTILRGLSEIKVG